MGKKSDEANESKEVTGEPSVTPKELLESTKSGESGKSVKQSKEPSKGLSKPKKRSRERSLTKGKSQPSCKSSEPKQSKEITVEGIRRRSQSSQKQKTNQ